MNRKVEKVSRLPKEHKGAPDEIRSFPTEKSVIFVLTGEPTDSKIDTGDTSHIKILHGKR